MIVNYYGLGCVKASVGSLSFAFNPPSKKATIKFSKFGADAAIISARTPEYNGSDQVQYGDRELFIADGPGEYEIQGIFLQGFPSVGPKKTQNTIYVIELDGIRICHLGALSDPSISPDVLEKMGEIDVVFVPTYNDEVISSSEAHKLATRLNPKVIVPLFYGGDKKDTLKEFLKEAGEEKTEVLDKWTVKRKDIDTMEGDVIVVKSF